MEDAQLSAALGMVTALERDVRQGLRAAPDSAVEHTRGQMVYRHAVALRRALEDWLGSRATRSPE